MSRRPQHNKDNVRLDDNWRGRGNNRGRGAGRGRGRGTGGRSGSEISYDRPVPTENGMAANGPAIRTVKQPQQAILNKRRMELMPSISRSSGLDKDGDSLRDHKIQDEYRSFIEEKLKKVLERRKKMDGEQDSDRQHRLQEQENVLILLRKLREGISSSNRNDLFSLEAYERSLYLSIIFESPKHATAIIPALVNDLYTKAPNLSTYRSISMLISLVHHLVTRYPSQSLYRQHRTSISQKELPKETVTWLASLTRSLRTGNHCKFEVITRRDHVLNLVEPGEPSLHGDLALEALLVSVDALRTKARDTIWSTIRSTYRELWFDGHYDTKRWLERTLCLDPTQQNSESMNIEQWISHVNGLGHVRKKEGIEGRWIVAKVR